MDLEFKFLTSSNFDEGVDLLVQSFSAEVKKDGSIVDYLFSLTDKSKHDMFHDNK